MTSENTTYWERDKNAGTVTMVENGEEVVRVERNDHAKGDEWYWTVSGPGFVKMVRGTERYAVMYAEMRRMMA